MTPMVSSKAWLTSGAGRSRLSLTMNIVTDLEMLLEWNGVENKIGME